MRAPRVLFACLAAILATSLLASAAQAHPLGNFTTNQLAQVTIDRDQAQVDYVLDQAEIPSFQQLQSFNADGLDQVPPDALAGIEAEILSEVQAGLVLSADGQPVPLGDATDVALSFPPGQGGLSTTRLEASFAAPLPATTTDVELVNDAFANRRGWTAIEILPGAETSVDSTVPASDPTDGLRVYPVDLRSSPLDQRSASFSVADGDGEVSAPAGLDGSGVTADRSGDGFADILTSSDTSGILIIFLLAAAFGWGALHALSPGHGKAMVAGYLVGARGTPRHAVILGMTVTATHTVSVFLLGAITLAASQFILPEDLYPWLTIASGLMVVSIGLAVMRSRFLRWRQLRAEATGSGVATANHDHGHTHAHAHSHDHGHSHSHDHGDGHSHSHGGHTHSHVPEGPITMKSLIALGVSGGIIPCPSALVVLIAAISQHRLGLGMVLIFAFSLGLAAALVAVGLVVIYGGRAIKRFRPEKRLIGARFAGALPALSASIIIVAGLLISLRALPELGL